MTGCLLVGASYALLTTPTHAVGALAAVGVELPAHTPPALAIAAPAPVTQSLPQQPPQALQRSIFPTTETYATLGYDAIGLGTARANKANPTNGGNAEGNWWTPSYVLDTDCEGGRRKHLREPCGG